MRRGGPGLAALDRSLHSSAQYSTLGTELTTAQLAELRTRLDVFSTALRQFAQQHRKDIVRDPEFRHAFQQMCANIGVDPLAGSGGGGGGGGAGARRGASSSGTVGKLAGLWNDFLGLGDFQNEISIQIIDVCVSTRNVNGGYIEMKQLVRAINRMRTGKDQPSWTSAADSRGKRGSRPNKDEGLVTEEDIERSIKLLKPLGSGYEIIDLPNRTRMVRSVPKELDTDSTTVMALLASSSSTSVPRDALGVAYITEDGLAQLSSSLATAQQQAQQRWSFERAQAVVHGMVLDGLLWIDEGTHPPRYYALTTLMAQAPAASVF